MILVLPYVPYHLLFQSFLYFLHTLSWASGEGPRSAKNASAHGFLFPNILLEYPILKKFIKIYTHIELKFQINWKNVFFYKAVTSYLKEAIHFNSSYFLLASRFHSFIHMYIQAALVIRGGYVPQKYRE
jgi:hypothetical protein